MTVEMSKAVKNGHFTGTMHMTNNSVGRVTPCAPPLVNPYVRRAEDCPPYQFCPIICHVHSPTFYTIFGFISPFYRFFQSFFFFFIFLDFITQIIDGTLEQNLNLLIQRFASD